MARFYSDVRLFRSFPNMFRSFQNMFRSLFIYCYILLIFHYIMALNTAKIPTDKTVRCFQILKYFFSKQIQLNKFSSRILTTDILSLFARTLSVKATISSSERAADSFFREFSHSKQGFSRSEHQNRNLEIR
jgi:hypothetical protein